MSNSFLSISSTEHDLEDQINEWANMTGFLLALGGVCLPRKSPAAAAVAGAAGGIRGMVVGAAGGGGRPEQVGATSACPS